MKHSAARRVAHGNGTVRKVLVVEPQCWGVEHVSVNAAMMLAVLAAYPDAYVQFLGEAEHCGGVCRLLTDCDSAGARRVESETIRIPARESTGWLRFVAEYRQYRSLLERASRTGADVVVFASITNSGILALKYRARRMKTSVPVLAVIHGMLNRIVGRWPRKPWNRLLNLRFVLRLPQPSGVKYVLLGDSIYNELSKIAPRFIRDFAPIDLPNLPNLPYSDVPSADAKEIAEGAMRFGHFGVGNITKGFGTFSRIAAECRARDEGVEFALVGYLSKFRDGTDYSAVSDVTESPVTVEEYSRRARAVTYVINTVNPSEYRLAASSSFVEALFYSKPGIYLRNPYVEHYFGLMGDIGYLCGTIEEVAAVVMSIVDRFPADRYQRQVANIVKGRTVFEPERVGRRLREIADRARAEVS